MNLRIACGLIFFGILSCSKANDIYTLPAFTENGVLQAVIEIPAGTNAKIEYNPETAQFEVDQRNGEDRIIDFLSYPGNYGFIPSTKGDDDDALDVLVISEHLPTASVIEVIPIGIFKLIDNGEFDYKVIAVPYEEKQQIIKATSYQQLATSYPEIKRIIESWFLSYDADDLAISQGWGDEQEALQIIEKTLITGN